VSELIWVDGVADGHPKRNHWRAEGVGAGARRAAVL
jgi:hypothetical protein